jgi:hypothetical protein
MILGFNSDVRYKGRTFHIQTEDSGEQNPVIITHLFTGGTILVTRRIEYGDALGRADLANHVRGLMRGQHREVMEALLKGELDDVVRRPPPSARPAEAPKASASEAPVPKPPEPAKAPPRPGPTTPPVAVEGDTVEVDPEEVALLESMEAELVEEAPRIGFPTDLISDQMLDAIILAYLTEDLDD